MIGIIKGLGSQLEKAVRGIVQMPQSTVTHFVNHQNRERTFVQQYAWVWFVALLCWMCLTVYCYKIDYEVLYALKYSSSHNHSSSWKEACFNAAVIQFLLLVCGGGFFKNLIFRDFLSEFSYNRTALNPHPLPKIRFSTPHTVQLLVLGALFVYGFHWTLSLSQKTGALAKVEAQENVDNIANSYKEKASTLQLEYKEKATTYRADARAQMASIESNYQDRIASIENKYAAIISKYEARYSQGSITKAHLQKRASGYQAAKEKALAPLLKAKAEKTEAIQKDLTSKLNTANSLYQENKTAIDYQASRARVEVNKQIEETAQNTQGRNVQFNFLNQLLWVALLIFAYSAKQAEPTPPTHTRSPKKKKQAPTYTGVGSTKTRSHTDTEEPVVQPTTNVHDTTQADSWQIYRWPRSGEQPLEFNQNGYQLQATNRTIKVSYKGKYESLGTLRSWAKKYEKEHLTDGEKYQEYCAMIKAMEVAKKELDGQEVLQRVG